MRVEHLAEGVTLYNADCRDVLPTLADIAACVTDPPYGLGFMGKHWDAPENCAFLWQTWQAVAETMKPGAHLLAFAGTRTQHRMAVAIEEAGFSIRDMIAWVYGSGFPKSLDVSKAIDKAGGVSPREQSEMLRAKRQATGLSREQVAEVVGCTPSSVRDWEEGRARATGAAIEFIVPSDEYRTKLANLLGYSADERRLIGVAADRRGDGSVYGVGHSGGLRAGGNTDAARQWQGWGTALKPALEPITVARKPLIGTVAENVLAHGTGALNIDGCRVDSGGVTESSARAGKGAGHEAHNKNGRKYGDGLGGVIAEAHPLGRWPANLIHDGSEEVLAGFPQAPGQQGDLKGHSRDRVSKGIYGDMKAAHDAVARGDTGSAARFFYCAKASRADRGEGNIHPTVKPTDLMRYLCRLVTPPGGVVLDPFMGSGSTGKAAVLEGFGFVGIEQSPEYFDLACRRISEALKQPDMFVERPAPAKQESLL